MIAIVTAIKEEAAALRWPLRRVTEGYSVTTVGVGRERALSSMDTLLSKGRKPDLVLALGFCGGLTQDLRPGCLALTTRFLALGEDQVLGASTMLVEEAKRSLRFGNVPFSVGGSLTVNSIVRDSRQKQNLAKEYGVATVNMEDYWLALACANSEVPFVSVRAVVDTFHDDLPAFVEEFASTDDSGRGLGIALGAIRRPGNLLSLLSMAKKAGAAKKSLGIFAGNFVPKFVSSGVLSPV
jgi:nucleoside phosphorylase